jgi:ABC-type transport system involved in multi-copper enzyme maturation permease subunit
MINLVRAELAKARDTRSMWLLAGIGIFTCVAWTVVHVLVFMRSGVSDRTVDAAYSMAQQGYVFAMVIGIIMVAGEYRHRTVTWTLLVTPRRGLVITAKLLAASVIGLVFGVASAVVVSPVAAVVLSANDYPVATGNLTVVLLGSVVSTALWCLLGAAIGALIRNMVAAITFAFVWFFYAEWLLVMMVPDVGRWTPTGVGKAVSGWTRDGLGAGPFATGDLLAPWAGGLVLIGYAVAAAVAARFISVRRDIT